MSQEQPVELVTLQADQPPAPLQEWRRRSSWGIASLTMAVLFFLSLFSSVNTATGNSINDYRCIPLVLAVPIGFVCALMGVSGRDPNLTPAWVGLAIHGALALVGVCGCLFFALAFSSL